MVRFSVCLDIVYDDEPYERRIERASAVGADAIEFWDWREKELDAIAAAADREGLPLVACTAGGTLTDPAGVEDAVATIRESIETAAEYEIPTLIMTTGPEQEAYNRPTQHEAIVEVLETVAPDAEATGVTLVLEPLNTAVDHPGYYLTSTAEGIEIVDAVDSPEVKLLYDVYHQQITEGNIIATMTEHVDRIGHIHIADVPGRHEPGTGELAYGNVFEALDDAGYEGYVGCEFRPSGDPDGAVGTTLGL